MTKVGILDDEIVICETLSKYLKELGYHVLDYALNYEEAIELLETNLPDIFLLDINIGGKKSGVDLAKYIRENYNIPLIFISSYSDKETILSAKKVSPNGYLVKPFNKEDLFAAIEIAIGNFSIRTEQNQISSELKLLSDAFFIKQDSLYIKICFNDIYYFKSEGVYVEIYAKSKKYLFRETLLNLNKILPEKSFFQIHRSYIININSIEAVNSDYIVLASTKLPISRTYRDSFLKKLNLI